MILAASICFVLAIASGWLLLIRRLMGRPLPMRTALVHGAVALTGVFLIALHLLLHGGNPALLIGFALLLVAAGLGIAVFRWHLRRQPIPVGLTMVHVITAVVGVIVFLIGASL